MRESRTYGSVRGAYDETHVPTATLARPVEDRMQSDQLKRRKFMIT